MFKSYIPPYVRSPRGKQIAWIVDVNSTGESNVSMATSLYNVRESNPLCRTTRLIFFSTCFTSLFWRILWSPRCAFICVTSCGVILFEISNEKYLKKKCVSTHLYSIAIDNDRIDKYKCAYCATQWAAVNICVLSINEPIEN